MRKVLSLLILSLSSFFLYAQDSNVRQIIDGSEPFVLKFNFAQSIEKSTKVITNSDVNMKVKFIPKDTNRQGTVFFIFSDDIIRLDIFDIQPMRTKGHLYYVGFIKENGATISALSWTKTNFSFIDANYTIIYTNK